MSGKRSAIMKLNELKPKQTHAIVNRQHGHTIPF